MIINFSLESKNRKKNNARWQKYSLVYLKLSRQFWRCNDIVYVDLFCLPFWNSTMIIVRWIFTNYFLSIKRMMKISGKHSSYFFHHVYNCAHKYIYILMLSEKIIVPWDRIIPYRGGYWGNLRRLSLIGLEFLLLIVWWICYLDDAAFRKVFI